MRDLLADWLPAADSPDRRGWEWFYLTSLPDQNVRTFTQSKGYDSRRVTTVAWHEPSNRLAEGSVDGTIRIWDVDREQPLFVLEGPVPRLVYWGRKWLAWSPDGSKLAAACDDGTVHLWDAAAGTKLRVLQARNTPLIAVAFSGDGTSAAAGQ
jgi:WD40 repeat protein